MKDGIHHHGPLAGIGAGAVAVLVAGVLVLVAARRQLGEVATVAAWVLMAAMVGAVVIAAVYAFLWLRHRVRHPEILAASRTVRAEVVDDPPQAVGPAPRPAAIEPPRVYLVTPDELAVLIRDTGAGLPRPGPAGGQDWPA